VIRSFQGHFKVMCQHWRLIRQHTPSVDQRQKVLCNEPYVNHRHQKTRRSTHFWCITTHSKTTGVEKCVDQHIFSIKQHMVVLKNVLNDALLDVRIQFYNV